MNADAAEWTPALLPFNPARRGPSTGGPHSFHQRTRGRAPSCDSGVSHSRSPAPRGYYAEYVIVADVFLMFGSPGQQCHFWNSFIGYPCECVYLQGTLCGEARKVIPLRVCYDRVGVHDFGTSQDPRDRICFLRYDAIEAVRVLEGSMAAGRVSLCVPWKEPFQIFVLGKCFRSSAYNAKPAWRSESIERRVSRRSTPSPCRRSWSPRSPTISPARCDYISQRADINHSVQPLTASRARSLPSNIESGRLVAYQMAYGSDWRVFGPTGGSFRWCPADRHSVSRSKKVFARALLLEYAREHSIQVDGDGFVRIALREGTFWISFRGGVAHAIPPSMWTSDRSRSRCRDRE